MTGLDPSKLPADIANILMIRGASIPPLIWTKGPSRFAKETLDRLDDNAVLFGRTSIIDECAASAVRAMLYLWNGWIAEAQFFAQPANELEGTYILALVDRHAGNPDSSKALLRHVQEHTIHNSLKEYTIENIGLGVDKELKRFKGILEQNEAWESFAFVDLFEQGRAGKLCDATLKVVRAVQSREFELLFAHNYLQATGVEIPVTSQKQDEPRRKRPEVRKKPTPRSEPVRSSPPKAPPKPDRKESTTISVGCPKCNNVAKYPPDARGKGQQCRKCGTKFMIPDGKGSPKARGPASSVNMVGIQCPKCGSIQRFPASARGTKQKCTECSTTFAIPGGNAKTPARTR